MLSLLLSSLIAATASQPLEPSGKWVVEYDKDMCVLARTYTAEKGAIILALRPYPMGTETEIVLMTPGGAAGVQNGPAELTLLPSAHVSKGTYARYRVNDKGRLSRVTLDADALDGIQTSTAITLRFGTKETYSVAIPKIATGMHALGVCQADLLKNWGIDPAEIASVVTSPKGNPARFFSPDVYPAEALRAQAQGRAIAVAVINKKGSIDTCVIAVTSGNLSLDHTTCEILKKNGRFSPGLDKDGHPVAAHLVVPVRWVLP